MGVESDLLVLVGLAATVGAITEAVFTVVKTRLEDALLRDRMIPHLREWVVLVSANIATITLSLIATAGILQYAVLTPPFSFHAWLIAFGLGSMLFLAMNQGWQVVDLIREVHRRRRE